MCCIFFSEFCLKKTFCSQQRRVLQHHLISTPNSSLSWQVGGCIGAPQAFPLLQRSFDKTLSCKLPFAGYMPCPPRCRIKHQLWPCGVSAVCRTAKSVQLAKSGGHLPPAVAWAMQSSLCSVRWLVPGVRQGHKQDQPWGSTWSLSCCTERGSTNILAGFIFNECNINEFCEDLSAVALKCLSHRDTWVRELP